MYTGCNNGMCAPNADKFKMYTGCNNGVCAPNADKFKIGSGEKSYDALQEKWSIQLASLEVAKATMKPGQCRR